jgi:hypothetical protein
MGSQGRRTPGNLSWACHVVPLRNWIPAWAGRTLRGGRCSIGLLRASNGRIEKIARTKRTRVCVGAFRALKSEKSLKGTKGDSFDPVGVVEGGRADSYPGFHPGQFGLDSFGVLWIPACVRWENLFTTEDGCATSIGRDGARPSRRTWGILKGRRGELKKPPRSAAGAQS